MSIGIFLTDLLKKFPGILYYQSIRERSEENKNIDYLYGLVYLGKRYEGLLEKLLSLNLTEKYVIISRTYIAFMAIIRLDLKKLENQIAELKTFPEDFFLQFPFNPLFCLETIYYYLRFGILRKEALIQLTQFYFFPVIQTNKSYPEAFNEILHLIGLYTIS
ncbi:MAG TPA: hypothetical protein DIT07_08550, partial [Sphingobacteriaceae bacterium]|nr:hypothetical protein [Sphingobacteriaceae bacterium]